MKGKEITGGIFRGRCFLLLIAHRRKLYQIWHQTHASRNTNTLSLSMAAHKYRNSKWCLIIISVSSTACISLYYVNVLMYGANSCVMVFLSRQYPKLYLQNSQHLRIFEKPWSVLYKLYEWNESLHIAMICDFMTRNSMLRRTNACINWLANMVFGYICELLSSTTHRWKPYETICF